MNNILLLPSNFSDWAWEYSDDRKFQTLLPKYLRLKLWWKLNLWDSVAILISDTDGRWRFDLYDALGNLRAWLQHKDTIGKNVELIMSATSHDLRDVLNDSGYSSVFTVGHSSYHSWRASNRSTDWSDVGNMMGDHLKSGVFANVGCWAIHSWNMVPFGYFAVSNHSHLYWYEAEYAYADTLGDLSRLSQLRRMPHLITSILESFPEKSSEVSWVQNPNTIAPYSVLREISTLFRNLFLR